MAFNPDEKREHYRRHPELRARYQRKWASKNLPRISLNMRRYRARKKRAAEIQAAKDILLSAHRLRAIGVRPY